MEKEKNDFFDTICTTVLRCFTLIFVGTYLLWWLVLDGPQEWDKKFNKQIGEKDIPIFLEDPLKNNNTR